MLGRHRRQVRLAGGGQVKVSEQKEMGGGSLRKNKRKSNEEEKGFKTDYWDKNGLICELNELITLL